MRARELLDEGGPLAAAIAGYERREAQLTMADHVEDAIEHEGVALIEAGTGTGKTLAYLVPAILSGKKVVVSTGTRNLQDQIMEQDLPLLARHLGVPFQAACMKGLTNYLCRRRYRALLASADADRPDLARRLPMLMDWVERTDTGDRAELAQLSEGDPAWGAVQSAPDTRIGARCSHYEECFVTAMRRRAEKAQIVVVNHHLFFADLATRGPHGGGVLPDYEAVIFDEAHQVEDVATRFFGVSVSLPQIEKLVRDAERALRIDATNERVLRRVLIEAEAVFGRVPPGPRDGRTTIPDGFFGSRYHVLDATLEELALALDRDAHKSETLGQLCRRAHRLREDLGRVAEASHSAVTWAERTERRVAVGQSPVDVSGLFRDNVVHRVPSVVLTSATLTTGGSFDFLERRLGIDFEVDEVLLESPFDHEAQSALYLPSLPDPRSPAYPDAAIDEIVRLVGLTGGGAFVLCTSFRMMGRFADACRPRLRGRPIYVQGEAPKNALLGRFKEDGDAVLFATKSFWEGVDVPGRALRLVIVDKLPFDVPTDPLVEARCKALEEEGEAAFIRYLVPSAALTLKQGYGRLLRSRSDRGIVAVLDSRLTSKGYGKVFLRSLPPARRCTSFDQLEAFVSESPVR